MTLFSKFLVASLFAAAVSSHAEPPAVTLYLLGYNIPDEQRTDIVEQDIAAFAQYQQKRINASYSNPIKIESPKPKFYDFDRLSISDLTLCDTNDIDGCLAQIEANPEPFRQSMQALAPVFQDIEVLQQSEANDFVNLFPKHLQIPSTPIPSYQLLTKPLVTKNALAYYDSKRAGNSAQAMTQICKSVAFGKSLIQSQDNLIQSMIGAIIVDSQLTLLAHTTQPLPNNCQDDLQPISAAETSICLLVKADSRPIANEVKAMIGVPILFSRRATIKQFEKVADPYCSSGWSSTLTDDERVSSPPVETYDPVLFNKIGAIIFNIAVPVYKGYQHRLQDSNAHLRLWQAALNPQCKANPKSYVTSIAGNWHTNRQLHMDDQQRLTITTYNESKTSDKSPNRQLSVGCREFEKAESL